MLVASFAAVAPPASASPVGPPVTLYLHSTPVGVGQADLVLGGSTMDTTTPTLDTPAVWYSTPVAAGANPNTIHDANWVWAPTDGFSFSNVGVTARFWAVSPGGVLEINGWDLQLWNDGTLVAASDVDADVIPVTPGVPAEYVVTFGPFSATGAELTFQIHPQFVDMDFAHALLYDSVDYPSSVEISSGADTTPPSAVTGLTVGSATANSLTLSWTAATDNVGVDHYAIYRGTTSGSLAFHTNAPGTSYVDTGLTSSTTYYYEVAAVDAANNVGASSSEEDGTTLAGDSTAPEITGPTTDAGATSARISWTTNEPATGSVEFGATTSYGSTQTTSLGTSHTVEFTGLVPDSTYHFRITATDTSSNSNVTGDYTLTTDENATYWLEAETVGAVTTLWASEIQEPGDVARGFNILGTVAGTAWTLTGVDDPLGLLASIHQDFPADPANPGLLLDATQDITGRLYVRFPTSLPTVGTVHPETVGVISLNLSVYADDVLVGGETVTRVVLLDVGFVPIDFSFPVLEASIPAGSLTFVVRPVIGTVAYLVGFENPAASYVTLPLTATLPLGASASFAGSARPMEDATLSFDGTAVGGVGPYTYDWDFSGEGSSTSQDPTFAFTTPGWKTVTFEVTDSLSNTAEATLLIRVLQRDFVDESRVVVAVIDTGVNPYHETYRRPGIELPLGDFVNTLDSATPTEYDLTFGADYATNVATDTAAVWSVIDPLELVWFDDTNVLGIAMGDNGVPVLDDPEDGHGTATSDTVLDAWPDATIVLVEVSAALLEQDMVDAVDWATKQPWIDVLSVSMGVPANAPEPLFLYQYPAIAKASWESGKLWAESSGNDPSPLITDGFDGSPYVLSITGTQENGQGKEIMSSYTYSDYGSTYTVVAATHQSTAVDASISGTSFSCPTVAGTIAGAVHELRRADGWDDGIVGGEFVTGIDNHDVRAALNKTARYETLTGYIAGVHANGDHAVTPVAPWTQVGWGHLDGSDIPAIVAVLDSGDLSLPPIPDQKGFAAVYMAGTYAARSAYWSAFDSGVPTPGVEGPGAELNVQPITPIGPPSPYLPNTDTTWTVNVPGATALSLHFEEFDVEAGFDFVFLEDTAGNVLQAYSLDGHLSFWTPYLPGDTVVVHFTSDGSVELDGFVVNEVDVV